MSSLAPWLTGSPYQGYAYAYPHKTAYRPLSPARALGDVWADEPCDALFLYVHVPFCEVRCGFCNLFATTSNDADAPRRYLDAIERQAKQLSGALSGAHFVRLAIGGGTPSYLSPAELERLFAIVFQHFGVDARGMPTSFELAPSNSDEARLAVLHERGVGRVSIGIQSFDEDETRALGRPQTKSAALSALARLRRFSTLNIDLIYGGEGQSRASFLSSIDTALRFEPEEIYLYPLYVRRLTGLSRRGHRPDDGRVALYRAGRDRLRERGYVQVSMRMFRAAHAAVDGGTEYCCQRDGMLGLGAGARSYTQALHYATEYAVGREGVRAVLTRFLERERDDVADYGFVLDDGERRRRWVIQSLLQCEGLDRRAYHRQFASDVLHDLPELHELVEHALATVDDERIRLNDNGIERSDVIGPWLASPKVQHLMQEYVWR